MLNRFQRHTAGGKARPGPEVEYPESQTQQDALGFLLPAHNRGEGSNHARQAFEVRKILMKAGEKLSRDGATLPEHPLRDPRRQPTEKISRVGRRKSLADLWKIAIMRREGFLCGVFKRRTP